MAGAPSIYCDFTDYDEIAHHAGPTRPESLASLAGLDHLIGVMQSAADQAPRPYEFVVLSDHGQSQGATFRQRYGQSLEELIRELLADRDVAVRAETNLEETAGPANTFLSQVSQEQGAPATWSIAPCTAGRWAMRCTWSARPARARPRSRPGGRATVVVDRRGRRGHRVRQPLDGLLHRVSRSADTGADGHGVPRGGGRARGARGRRVRDDAHRCPRPGRPRPRRHPLPGGGPGRGHRPAGSVRPRAAQEVIRHAGLAHVGDLVLNSPLDVATDEVGAYEELVGNHGGLGGWQTRAVLVHPAAWPVDDPPLAGADAVHRQLVRWLRHAGQRTSIADPPSHRRQAASPLRRT